MSARSLKVYIRENIEHTDGMGDTTKRTMLSWACIVCFAACLSGVAAQGSVQVNTVEIRLSVGFEVGGGARDLVDAELVLVRTFLAAQVQSACTTATATCVVGQGNVALLTQAFEPVFDAALALRVWHLSVTVSVTDTTEVLRVQSSGQMSAAAVQAGVIARIPGFSFHENAQYQVLYHGNPTRPHVCGDSVVQNSEQCDDGNLVNGDGCSSLCVLEANTMCYSSVRATAGALGTKVAWQGVAANGTRVLAALSEPEGCTTQQFCDVSTDTWDPTLWTAAYANNVEPNLVLPAAGFYCSSFCRETFVPPENYEFTNSCTPVLIDKCARGMSTCAANAYCTQGSAQAGYSCRCNERSFVNMAGGTSCFSSGVQLIVRVVGQAYSTPNLVTDEGNMLMARSKIMLALLNTSYLIASSEVLLQEGVVDYPVESTGGAIVSGPFAGRSLWRVILRFPTNQVDMAAVATGAIFDSSVFWNSILSEAGVVEINTVQRCENDRRVTCSSDADCVGAATCVLDRPDIEMEIKSEGGATAPLQVTSAGADVLSVDYNMTEAAFKIRLRYDNTIKNVINSVFLSHITTPVSASEMATFNNDEFPCLPAGVGQFQQRRENSGMVCAPRVSHAHTHSSCTAPPTRLPKQNTLCWLEKSTSTFATACLISLLHCNPQATSFSHTACLIALLHCKSQATHFLHTALTRHSVLPRQFLRRLHHTRRLWRVHQRRRHAAQGRHRRARRVHPAQFPSVQLLHGFAEHGTKLCQWVVCAHGAVDCCARHPADTRVPGRAALSRTRGH